MYSKNLSLVQQNLYFKSFNLRQYLLRQSNTIYTCLIQSTLFLEYISILSRYAITNILRYFLSILFIRAQKIAGTLVSLNSITQYLQCLYLVQNAIFYSSPFFILIQQYLSRRSSNVNIFTSKSLSCSLEILGSRYLFFCVIALSLQQSTQSCKNLFFLETKRIRNSASKSNSQIYSFARFLLIYSLTAFSCSSNSLYISRKGSILPSSRIIL